MSTTGLESLATCRRCNAPLAPDALECLQCHALVHAEELERIAAEAKELESQSQLRAARERWLAALALLPGDAQQVSWINKHAVDLYARALEAEALEPQKSADRGWARKFGPLAPLLILLSKAKSLLLLLKFNFLFSLFAFVGFYWAMFGKWFGIGFAALILCHEMGHFVEVRRRHLPVDLPVFLPGFGAYVKWKNLGVSASGRAMIGLAGPLAGLLSAFACLLLHYQTHSALWLALARVGAWLNLLNLIPIWALDGGHAIEAVNKLGRIVVLTVAVILYWISPDFIFLAIAIAAAWQAFFVRDTADSDFKIAAYFAVLMIGFAVVLWLAPGQGFGDQFQ